MPNNNVQATAGTLYGDNSADSRANRDKDGMPKLTIDSVRKLARSKGITLSAQDETALMQDNANDAARSQAELQLETARRSAPLDNEIANQNTQRNMVVNAQKYNADNVANQLNNLQAARATNAQAISSAMATTASLFK
jgi:hypothetical protein